MTTMPFFLLAFLMAALSITWLTRPLWHRGALASSTSLEAPPDTGRSLGLAAGLGLFVLAVAAVGYAIVGAPRLLGPVPVSSPAAPESSSSGEPSDARAGSAPGPADDSVSQAESRVSAMVDSLAERMKTRPDDAEGWQLLGRSYAALGKHAQAVAAFKNALRLRPDNATLLADYAFSAAVLDPRSADGEPAQLVTRALQIEPKNRKALALAGTLALDRKDFQGAIRYWEQLAQIEPADTPIGKQIQFSIMQARQLASTQANLGPSAVTPPPSTVAAGTAQARVSGTVTLAPALAASAAPDDTVFIFARSTSGPRMPLAVLRKQVKDLPLRFTLDDSLAVSPSSKLSNYSRVIVGARISRAGNATAREGDLEGQLAEVSVGSDDLRIQIGEVVHTH